MSISTKGSLKEMQVMAGPCQAPSRTWRRTSALRVLSLMAGLPLLACANVPTDPAAHAEYKQNNDPAEPTNRVIFAGNKFVDDHAMQPVARAYVDYVPRRVRGSIHNFVGNLGGPSIAVNDLLQGNLGRAWNTTERFAINTTVGGAGLFDVATGWDRPGHKADFGQTLGVWGVGPGPSVQLPLFGPSNVRDALGKVAGMVTDPLTFATGGVATIVKPVSSGLGMVDGRGELLASTDSLEHGSLDYYAALRSVTAQHRAAFVAEGKVGAVDISKDVTPAPSTYIDVEHAHPAP